MVDEAVLDRVRNGICAVGYLTVPLDVYIRDPLRPYFKVVGTGFLVRATTAITNSHVIEALVEAQASLGFTDNQKMLSFVSRREGAKPYPILRMIRRTCTSSRADLDVGFIEFQRAPDEHFVGIEPLVVDEGYSIRVTESVAVCGYPYGEAMLQRDGKVYRWGPVVQQGHVSAMAPFDRLPGPRIPSEMLLDVRIAGGMSGAPIFRPQNGTVCGIVHSAWETTTAVGLPLTRPIIDGWLRQHDETTSSGSNSTVRSTRQS